MTFGIIVIVVLLFVNATLSLNILKKVHAQTEENALDAVRIRGHIVDAMDKCCQTALTLVQAMDALKQPLEFINYRMDNLEEALDTGLDLARHNLNDSMKYLKEEIEVSQKYLEVIKNTLAKE